MTKDEILKEIRRTAKENGGIPLGEHRFRDETGITPTDWGKHWPRFGDAQTEAGFNKNIFGSASYSQEYVFEKFILLSRELGKFPVSGDWKVKRHNDPDFPSINSLDRLSRHLGSRQEFITALMKYSEDKGYKDIVKIFNARQQEKNSIEEGEDVPLKEATVGYVYLKKSTLGNATAYKIGKAKDLPRRIKELRQRSNDEVLLHSINTDDMSGVEDYWHNRFKTKRLYPKRLKDEWFKLNFSDVKAFKRWKKII